MNSPASSRDRRTVVGDLDERRPHVDTIDSDGPGPESPDPGPSPTVPVACDFSLEHDGESWIFSCDDETHSLKDTKGVRILVRLVANPGRELHVLDLTGQAVAQQAVAPRATGGSIDDTISGGSGRHAGRVTERARINVQRRLKDAIERVETLCPSAGRHLQWSVRTGTYCVYEPK